MSLPVLEQLSSSITPQLTGYLAKLTGETPAGTSRAIQASLPAVLSAMAGSSRTSAGLSTVTRLIGDRVNDGTLLTQLPALYQGTMTAAPVYRLGTQLLQGVFGNKLSQATQTVAVISSIKPASSALIMSTLAPHILSIVGQSQRDSGGTDAANIARFFDREQSSIAAALPPSLANLFGAPTPQAAAAYAASGIAPARDLSPKPAIKIAPPEHTRSSTPRPAELVAAIAHPTPPNPAIVAAVQPARVPRPAARPTPSRQTSAVGSLWLIFPVGLLMAAGALGLGSLIANIANEGHAPAKPPIRAAEVLGTPAASITTGEASPAFVNPTQPTETAAKSPSAPAGVAITSATPAPTPVVAAPQASAKPVGKPALIRLPEPETPRPLGLAGTTSYFGTTLEVAEAPAVMNPDYIRDQEAAVTASRLAARLEAEKVEAAKLEAEKAERAKLEAEKAEVAKLEAEKAEVAKLEAAKAEAAKVDAEKAELAKLEAEKAELAKTEAEKAERAKLDAEKAEAARLEAAKAETAKLEAEKAQLAKLEAVKGATAETGRTVPKPDLENQTVPDGTAAIPARSTSEATAVLLPCRNSVADAVKSGSILFQSARADLENASIATLDRIASAFQSCPKSHLRIEGHTDNSGLPDTNQALSEARAQAVTGYLTSKGIDASRISATGFGDTRPVVPNVGAANKALNRRIEFAVDAL